MAAGKDRQFLKETDSMVIYVILLYAALFVRMYMNLSK